MGTSLSVQATGLREQLDEKVKTIYAAAPEHVDVARYNELAVRACIQNPDLFECNRATLFTALASAVSLGLEIGGPLGHAYLIPFKGQVALVPGYLGLKELAYRSGRIASIETGRVKPDDEFEWEKGTSQFLKHKPTDSPVNGAATHVYAIVRTTTHGTMFEVMSWAQVEWHRNKFSKGWQRKDSAWQANPVAMAEKTVLRKVLKLCPLSAELQRMMQEEEYSEASEGFTSGAEQPPDDLDAAAKLIAGEKPDDNNAPAVVSPPNIYGTAEDGSLSFEEQQALFTQQGIPF